MITVFTPTYNRADYLTRLYKSLIEQSYKNFEWLVVDDGSTDNTQKVMEDFVKDNLIAIRLIVKSNEGKHIAINTGAANAKGELFFTVDSDDYLPTNALERVAFHWNNVSKLPEQLKRWMIGVSGHRMYQDGKIIGGAVDYEELDIDLLDFRFKNGVKGDKAEVYLTEVVRNNPFPKFEGENFCPESLVYYRLANQGYKLRQFNESIYVGEYLEGGLTSNALQTTRKNIMGSLQGYADVINFKKVPFKVRVKYAILFWRFSFLDRKRSLSEIIDLLTNKIFVLLLPAGWLFHLKDKKDNRI